jgi:molecular chaperone DnaK
MTVLIPRNTTIPTRKTETFSTAEDNQTQVEIHVLQGERELALYNKTIGKFQLTGIPPAPRGMPQVEVTFDIDANGILHVTAKDKTTGKEQKIRIEASSGISDTEIQRMVKDAEQHANEDKERREQIDLRNRLDSLSYEVEKNVKEWEDRISPEQKSRVEAAIERARKAHRGEDVAEIRAALEELTKAYQEAGQSMYAQQQAAQGAEGAPTGEAAGQQPGTEPQEEVAEAEYEIVDDKKSGS